MKTSRSNLKVSLSERGQVTVEYILIMAVFIAMALSVKTVLNSNESFKSFVQGPWSIVAGMIETGVWGSPEKNRPLHPGSLARHRSLYGVDE